MELILLGIDGAEPSLVETWGNQGYLPNFARLIHSGAYGSCLSTLHPITPQAWASIITGVNPGRHGIFDFGKRKKDGYEFELITGADRAFPAFWELPFLEKKVGIINVPVTHPPDPVDGFFVGGMHTPSLADGVYPKGLEEKIPGYIIDVMCHWYDKTEEFLDDVDAMCDARHEAVFSLIDKIPVDLLFPVYVAGDRIQHALWGAMTERHIKRPGWGGGHGDAVFNIYHKLDKVLGDYMDLADTTGAHLMVVSDHGFGDLKKDVYLNALLAKEGLLVFDPFKVRNCKPQQSPQALDPTHDWQRRAFPEGEISLGSDEQIAKGEVDARCKTFDTVDWAKTVAYSAGLFGNIWINLRGREPQGIVKPGAEYEKLRDRIINLLEDLTDPDDGLPIVDKAYKREQLYSGPKTGDAPDILVKMRDYSYITRGSTEFLCNNIVSDVVVNHSGNHRRKGIVGIYGKSARPGHRIRGAEVYDIVPTLLYLLDRPIPKGLDGKVMRSALSERLTRERSIQMVEASGLRKKDGKSLSKKEEATIRQRLKALGYLG